MKTRQLVIKSGKEGNFFKRIVLVMLMILLELGFLAFIYTQFIMSFLWFLFVPYGLGIIFACRVAVSQKNYDSKIAWILFLLILAPVAIFVYLFAGEIATTPLKALKIKRINKKTKHLKEVPLAEDLSIRVKQDCSFIQNTSDYVPYFNSNAKYFSSGEEFFEDALTRLKKAKKFIFLDFFILEEGHLTKAIFEILNDKVKEGVDIRIIVDGLGSHGALSLSNVKRIRKSGIKILAFEPILPWINFFMNYRDHRKILIIDGVVGYVGGTNIADEYINAKERFGKWKDASLLIEGEAVRSLTLMFLRMWEYSSRAKPDYEQFLGSACEGTGDNGSVIIPYADGVSEVQRLGLSVYNNIIANAKESLFIMTPYFIVDNALISLLKAKALSGVDVRIVLPGVPDKRIVYSLSRHNAERLIGSGVKVFVYTPGFLHSKVMLSDNECAVVGSINMDFRSFYQQYESAAYLAGTLAINEIANDFETTFAQSKEIKEYEIKKPNPLQRVWLGFLKLFAPLM